MREPRDSAGSLSGLPDADIVGSVRRGDMAALEVLYVRHAPALMAVAWRLLRSRDDAEDVLHDVFVGLPEALRKYDERGQLGAWLRQITARVALGVLRKRETRERHDVVSEPFTEALDHDSRITLDSAVAALPPALRTVVVLKEIEGFSHAEIADMLGISTGASEVRLHRAIRALRAAMRGADR